MALVGMCLIGCSPKIPSYTPPTEEATAFSQQEGDALIDQWWLSFGDEQLNALMDSAFADNQTLSALWQRVEAARAIRSAQFTRLLPDIEARAQTAISRPEPDFAGGENTQLGLSASYEVDLWGRIRASIQAEDFRIEASYYDYQTAAMTLSADVASLWVQLLTTNGQIELIDQQIANNQQAIQSIEARFGAGQVKGVDVLRQRQLLEQSQSLKIGFGANYQLIQNQLAVLLGQPPQNFELPEVADSLPGLPASPATGLPLELVRRRPDLQRQYNLLMASDREMAVAILNRFPRLSLDLAAQARSNNYGDLFNNWAYTLGGNLIAPLLYWGRLRAEVDRAEAVKNEQLYQYGQSVLNAFLEVENALINEQRQRQQIAVLRSRLNMAQQTNQQLRTEFIYGVSQYLDVLLAQEREQQLQRDLVEAVQQQYEIRISLYRALAGDFDLAPATNEDKSQ
jgi:NodT family efflux transporter outer membrane factor (OMF) lipoprotein